MEGREAGRRRKVLVVGGGISGLSCAFLLHRSGEWDVTLMEKEEKCGGHTITLRVPRRDHSSTAPAAQEKEVAGGIVETEEEVNIDVGFQVYNLTTYPHFVELLELLKVETMASDMSFSYTNRDVAGKKAPLFEWGSAFGARGMLQNMRANISSPLWYSMVADIFRFEKDVSKALLSQREGGRGGKFSESYTVAEFLRDNKYGAPFIDYYFIPMNASIWSSSHADILSYSFLWLARFWRNHHLLNTLSPRPIWRVVKGGSYSYVQKILDELEDGIVQTKCEVLEVSVEAGGIMATVARDGKKETNKIFFDHVVFACHSDRTHAILKKEKSFLALCDILKEMHYTDNEVVVHTDEAFMPERKSAWASWNFCDTTPTPPSYGKENSAVSVTYWANLLANLDAHVDDYFVTLNPRKQIEKNKVVKRYHLSHPLFTSKTKSLQRRVASLQGSSNVWLCGAWLGYGFHEDGLKSAIDVVKGLKGKVPWDTHVVAPNLTIVENIAFKFFDGFMKRSISEEDKIKVILPNGMDEEEREEEGMEEETQEETELFHFIKEIGLGEAYMKKDILVDDVVALLDCLVANVQSLSKHLQTSMSWFGMKVAAWAHYFRANTLSGSKRNIKAHYDIGNDLYQLFLDETMTYSSGIHLNGKPEPLIDAQLAKIDQILELARVDDSSHILEVGCGWGGFALRAAETCGCRVTGITLSREQLYEAQRRAASSQFSHLVDFIYLDYRDLVGYMQRKFNGVHKFDAVVSIEMIEAVGHSNLELYFRTLEEAVQGGGRIVIQAISIPDSRYVEYTNSSDFIREHIFPGGHLPSYALTLQAWRERFSRESMAISNLGYDEEFQRKWIFYFAYCEAAFKAQYLHDYILTFESTRPPPPPYPLSK